MNNLEELAREWGVNWDTELSAPENLRSLPFEWEYDPNMLLNEGWVYWPWVPTLAEIRSVEIDLYERVVCFLLFRAVFGVEPPLEKITWDTETLRILNPWEGVQSVGKDEPLNPDERGVLMMLGENRYTRFLYGDVIREFLGETRFQSVIDIMPREGFIPRLLDRLEWEYLEGNSDLF